MKWKVIWRRDAERQLMSLLLADRFRQHITECAYQINAALAINPYEFGESRGGNYRIVFAPPLVASVEVAPEQQTVFIRAVWRS